MKKDLARKTGGISLEEAAKMYADALKAEGPHLDIEPLIWIRPPEKRSRFKKAEAGREPPAEGQTDD